MYVMQPHGINSASHPFAVLRGQMRSVLGFRRPFSSTSGQLKRPKQREDRKNGQNVSNRQYL